MRNSGNYNYQYAHSFFGKDFLSGYTGVQNHRTFSRGGGGVCDGAYNISKSEKPSIIIVLSCYR